MQIETGGESDAIALRFDAPLYIRRLCCNFFWALADIVISEIEENVAIIFHSKAKDGLKSGSCGLTVKYSSHSYYLSCIKLFRLPLSLSLSLHPFSFRNAIFALPNGRRGFLTAS